MIKNEDNVFSFLFNLFIYFACYYTLLAFLSVCLSVSLYPINLKTAGPIGPKYCVGPHMTPKLKKCVFKSFEILKMREKYYLIRELFLLLFYIL